MTNVNFECPKFEKHWTKPLTEGSDPAVEKLNTYMIILAICHTIIIEEKNGTLVYNASSPDELALTNAARHFGVIFKERDEDNNMVVENIYTG